MKALSQPAFAKRKAFGMAITKSIQDYFKDSGFSKTGDWRIWHKTIVLFLVLAGNYYVLLAYHQSMPAAIALLLCVLMSITKASIGFNVMHDANHKSYSTNKTVNYVLGLSLNLLGANAHFWKVKHNECHHVFTNLVGHDEDIDAPLLRFHKDQEWKSYHRFQFLYWPLMYGLLYVGWIYFNDFKKYFRGRVQGYPLKMDVKEHLIFWGSKLLYGFIFVYLPLQFIPLSAFLVGYGVMLFSCGLFISVIFQLAHVVEVASQPTALPQMESERVYHQIATTANFATKNKILGWLCGGLNYQVEHHLVPHVSHVHYPALSDRVKKVCKEFGYKYNEYRSFYAALWSHLVLLYVLGRKPVTVHVHNV